ncbi:unnamed protein product [Trichogramma brassicae]|uniref:Reverse transcriptase domain-containing protein n=1 Tax=Trichogramma brassicae TaxID=86971 RepID=A0A6H5HXW1_9HYME|nr:unnamed protein product [Trichogramma brassicae]
MGAYKRLGPMRRVTPNETSAAVVPANYIPHHGIWQQGDAGAKLRVVFDALRPTSSGASLNDVLCRGPKLQRDIWVVLLRWRTYKVAFCSDVRMMFRQIKVNKLDVDWQCIPWSPNSRELARHFQLLTVTYGTACAPYLSLRTLQQLCDDEGDKFPRARIATLRDRYVDDVLSGADDVEDALTLRDELIQLIKAGRLSLG